MVQVRSLAAAVLLLAFCAAAFGLGSAAAGAAEVTSCDIGPVTGARITIDGTTYHRPDSRIDGQPSTTSRGPFIVAADVDATVARIDVVYWTQSTQTPEITAMPIAGSVATGTIPSVSVTTASDTAFFYLQAFDSLDNLFWIDDLRAECVDADGIPYRFNIEPPKQPVDQASLPLTGTPICIEHPTVQADPSAADGYVGDQFSTASGERFLIVTGEPSCAFNCDDGADANCDNVLGDYCPAELDLHAVRDVRTCLARNAPAINFPNATLAHTGADAGVVAFGLGLVGVGAVMAGWAARRSVAEIS